MSRDNLSNLLLNIRIFLLKQLNAIVLSDTNQPTASSEFNKDAKV